MTKAPRSLSGIAGLTLILTLAMTQGVFAACPRPELGEKTTDCPWAEVARTLAAQPDMHKAFAEQLPNIVAMLSKDKETPGLLQVWGESRNFDEQDKNPDARLPGAQVAVNTTPEAIVSPTILKEIFYLAGLTSSSGLGVHAGLTHTYGYLLSTLTTPFGFKRARWVNPTIDDGFGFPRGSISPRPKHGTLLANVTALLGAIAFRDDVAGQAALAPIYAAAAPAISKLDLSKLDIRRLTERIVIGRTEAKQGEQAASSDAKTKDAETTRRLEFRTDIVRFPVPPKDKEHGLGYLLVYSVQDSIQAGGARLITGFPVTRSFVDELFDPKRLGLQQAIRPRYNAMVANVDSATKNLVGNRSVNILSGRVLLPLVFSDNDWPPFFFAGKDGEPPGLGKEIIMQCLPTTGFTASFSNLAIKRLRTDMERGALDLNLYSYEPERESFALFGHEPIFRSEYRPVVRADSQIEIKRIADFDALRLGHLNGLKYSDEFYAYIEKRRAAGTLDVTDSEESNLRKLIAGRFDVFVNSTPTVLWLSHALGLSAQIKVLPFTIKSGDYFMTLSKATKRMTMIEKEGFLAAMDGCLRVLKKDGSYRALMTKYQQP